MMPSRSVVPIAAILLCALLGSSCSRSVVAPVVPPTVTPTLTGNELVGQRVVVSLLPGVDAQALAGAYDAQLVDWQADERIAAYLPPTGTSPADFALVLAADPNVESCEADEFLEPSESRQQSFSFDDGLGSGQTYAEQPAAAALGLSRAHTVTLGAGVLVAVLDTGVDTDHPALRGRVVPGYDFLDGDADPRDVTNGADDDGDGHVDEAFGHGTHVAGIIALVAPAAEIMPIRVLDADGRGNVLSVAAGIRWAIANRARVINLSLGMLKSSDGIQHALEDAEHAGIIIVSSAGNWGAPEPEEFPATSSHAHAVGAVSATAEPAPFSSYGDFVLLSAPGMGVRSLFPGGEYRLWSGTSMSAPFVAGAAALLKGLHPNWGMDQVEARLVATAASITGGTPEQRAGLGAGMLDVGAALAAEPRMPTLGDTPPDPPLRIRRPD